MKSVCLTVALTLLLCHTADCHQPARKIASGGSEGRRISEDQLPGLDVALPYLAGTYDERMFDRLRTRAQVFDILTGGDPTADQDSASLWLEADSEGQDDGSRIVPLPRQMLDDLRLDLAITLSFEACGTLAKSLEQ